MARRYHSDRQRDLTEQTELRIHGVGGARPEELLDRHHPTLVAGDRIGQRNESASDE